MAFKTRKYSNNKKETIKVTNGDNWAQIAAKYNNKKIEKIILEMMGKINSSTFEIIEYDLENEKVNLRGRKPLFFLL